MPAARKDEVDTGFVHSLLQSDMQLWRPFAKFQHVTQHRNTPQEFLSWYASECCQRGAHRRRVRVVALIDQKSFAPVDPQSNSRAAPARWRQSRKRRDSRLQVSPDRRERPDGGKGIFRDVPPRHGETETKAFIADTNRHVAAVDRKLKIFAADVRRRAETETHWLDAKPFRNDLQPRGVRIVMLDDRGAARHQSFEDFGFGIGDGFDIREVLEMHGFDRRDYRRVRTHHLR